MPDRSKKLKTGDYVEVLVPLGKDADGNPVFEKGIVPRGTMMDDKWNDVKARAARSGRHSTTMETKGARVVPDEGSTGDVIRLRDQSGALLTIHRGDMDETAWWKRVVAASEKDSFEGATLDGEDIRTRKKPTEEGANLGAERPPERTPSPRETGTMTVDEQALEDQYGSGPSKGQPYVKVDPVTGERTVVINPSTVKKKVYDPSMESGGGTVGSMLRKIVGGAVEGATPQPGPGVANTGGGAAGPGPAEGLATQGPPPGESLDMVGLPAATKSSEPPQALDMTGIPAGTGRTPLDVLKSAGNSLMGPSPDAQLADLQSQSAALQPLPQQPQPPAPAPAPVAPPPTSTSAGLKISGRTGPSSGPGSVSSLDEAEKQFIAGQQKLVATEEKAAADRLQARVDHESNVKKLEAEQAGARLRQREEEDRINQAYLSTLDEMTKKQQVDPDHFWSSKSVGQKAFMAIGGFLAGLGGRDPSARLDQMIQQDIAVQRENFNLAKESGKLKLAGLDTVYGRLRQRGLDDREAAAAARASMNDAFANRLTSISEQMAPGEAKAKADMVIAQFRMNKVKAEDDLKNSASERYARAEALRLQNVKMEMSERAAIEKAKKPTPMQATLSKEMAALEDALASLRNMKSLAGGGFVERARTQWASGVPGGGILDPNRRAKARIFKGEAYADMIQKAKGALQEAEIKRLSEIVPQEISAFEDPAPYFERAIAFVEQQIARRKERYDRSGPDVRGESAGGQGGAD